ncbi:DUF6115 domain-containing protein [Caldisalinibacter kiritimatiensis]|uniref:Uncharacterized protein n=1 Tax=Caldisalinibacter kiritimatiensis TaxID=1304284 RepID=R1CLZ9_9FIRM|nr:hypothetical protein [Caldisalinibacter kiritimatiensis]EOC99735.1 hypothetical protein L21TH_2265 [Caldisalinibacter kiritimatiensis]
MINIILFIIGVVCIIVTFILLIKEGYKETNMYQDILKKYEEIKLYNNNIINILDSLEEIADSLTENNKDDTKISIKDLEIKNNSNKHNTGNKSEFKKILNTELNSTLKNSKTCEKNNIKDKILELKKSGYDNSEIAKKLGRGKREIDIILKMKDD